MEIQLQEVNSMEPKIQKELVELLINVVEEGASIGFISPLNKSDADEYWKEVIQPGTILYVAREDQKIVGSVQLHLALKENGLHRAEVAKLMVHTGSRRKGIARKLMYAIEEKAKSENRSLLVLDTRAGDPSNILYLSLGYIESGRIPKYAKSSNGKLDDTVYYYKEV
jgi:ribosomal protein S18 acetylase RimI-like enzyme